MSNFKALLLSNGALKTFNSKNEWVTVGSESSLTGDLILAQGFSYDILEQSFDKKYSQLTETETLEDGSVIYTSGELTKDMGITAITETTIDDVPYLELTVPPFTPKDSILVNDKLVLYAESSDTLMEIETIDFSSTTTHNTSVSFDVKVRYFYNKGIKMAFKVNDGEYGEFTNLVTPMTNNILSGLVLANTLKIGSNDITIKIANEDETIVVEETVAGAITVTNTAPSLLFITADSDSFKCHFKIVDTDMDKISYRVTLTNSANQGTVLKDWSEFTDGPIEDVIYFDTTMIKVGEQNILKVEYKDSMDVDNIISATYVFEGKYKNLMFIDENGGYYTTDKGVLIKYLDFHQIIAGTVSDVKSVTLRNDNAYPVDKLTLKLIVSQEAIGTNVLLSKNRSPFIGSNILEFGDEVIGSGETKEFFVRVDTDTSASGVCNFEIDATASYVSVATEESTSETSEVVDNSELIGELELENDEATE